MRLIEIHLDGFAKLANRTFQFAPGFNLVFGPNEAGKSTLQRAVLALLYGFFDEGPITSHKHASLMAFRPWDTKLPYAGSLAYALDDGQTFRVVRRFAPRLSTRLVTYSGGSNVSAQFSRASRGRLFFADAHLGMSKELFETTCYVRQAELAGLDLSASAMSNTLMRLSSSPSMHTTATGALNALQAAIRDHVGSRRAKTKPLGQATARLAKLERERKQVLAERDEAFSQLAELSQEEKRIHSLEQERDRLHYLRALAERDALRRQLSAAEQADAKMSRCTEEVARWEEWASFPAHLRDAVIRLSAQWEHLRTECGQAEQRVSAAKDRPEQLNGRIAAAEDRVAALQDARDVPLEELTRVQELANEWRVAQRTLQSANQGLETPRSAVAEARRSLSRERAALEPAIELGHAGLAGLYHQLLGARQRAAEATQSLERAQAEWRRVAMDDAQFAGLERAVQKMRSQADPPPKILKGCRPLLLGHPAILPAQPPTELLTYAQVRPLHERLVRCQAETEAAHQALRTEEARITSQLGPLIGNNLDEDAFERLSQRLESYQRASIDVEHHRAIVSRLEADLATLRDDHETALAALRAKLEQVGFEATDVEPALDEYARQCERRRQLEREEATLQQLRLRVQTANRDVAVWQERCKALEAAEVKLRELLAQAEILTAAGSLEDGLARFDQQAGHHKRWADAQAALQASLQHREALSAAHPPDELSASLAELESELASALSEHPEWSKQRPDKTPQEYAALAREVEAERASASDRWARHRESILPRARGLRHPAGLDEEIALAKAAIRRIEAFRDALELAHEELTQATDEHQRELAPRLEPLLSEGLGRITGGRYSNVQVDPESLAVSLVAPESGRLVSAEQLSTGTRDLVYLMVRVAITQLMSRTEESLPLLLDDPFAQSDRARLEQALGFLAQLAEATQILLFTKDDLTRDWFELNLGDQEAHRLHRLDSPGAPG